MTSGIADGSATPGGPVTGSDTPFYTIGQVAELLVGHGTGSGRACESRSGAVEAR